MTCWVFEKMVVKTVDVENITFSIQMSMWMATKLALPAGRDDTSPIPT